MSDLLSIGAAAFGALVGWYVYYINRYRKGDVGLGDIVTLLGAVGGAAVPKLFTDDPTVFGAYGLGLALGFFGYFLNLLILVRISKNFDVDWFLDGRRLRPIEPYYIPNEVAPTYRPEVSMHLESAIVSDGSPSNGAAVIDMCESEWPANSADCSAFARDVAGRFGIRLTGDANAIVVQIQAGGGWQQLRDGIEAAAKAESGSLVVAGLKGSEQAEPSEHGHVVIVVAGPLAQGKYPSAYWGKLGAIGEKNKTINWAWRAADRDRVHYAAIEIGRA